MRRLPTEGGIIAWDYLTHVERIVASEWISPADVRNQMMSGGFKNDDKAKLLSYVFATLKRLASKGEFEGKKLDGKMKYRKRQPAAMTASEAA